MDKIKAYGAHAVAYAVSLLTLVAGLDPALMPPKVGVYVGAAGILLAAAHNVQAAGEPKPGTVTSVAKMLAVFCLLILCTVGIGSTLVACKTLPTAKEQTGVAIAVNVLAGRAIQRSDTDPSVWAQRAEQYKAVAEQIRATNSTGTASLATLNVELHSIIAKNLGPADQIAANAVVDALRPYVQEQVDQNPDLAGVNARVDFVLATFISTCNAYGAQ